MLLRGGWSIIRVRAYFPGYWLISAPNSYSAAPLSYTEIRLGQPNTLDSRDTADF